MTVHADQPISQEVAERVEAIVAAAEQATVEFRRQAESDATRYETEVRARADADAHQLRVNAEAEVERYLADARARIDSYANERLSAISGLTDRLIEHTDKLQERFEAAETVRRQLYDLIAAIGEAAERLAEETAHPGPEMPSLTNPRARRADEAEV
jgi:hypothetical protein